MGHCIYSTHAAVCSRSVEYSVIEKFSSEINGISAHLLAGLFEKKNMDIMQFHCHLFLLLYSMSC